MTIREASTADVPTIRAIAHATWPVSYKAMISKEQIAYMLGLMYSESSLLEQLTVRSHCFLLAEQEGRTVGFASYELNRQGSQRTRLHKLYVLPDVQRRGAGRVLLNSVVTAARAAGDRSIDLTVNKRNNALPFYFKQGFTIERDVVMDIGQGFVMDDHVLIRTL